MSILIAIVAPVDTFFIPEYWHPVLLGSLLGLPIDIFTILFGFCLGGISSVLYEELFKKTYRKFRKRHHDLKFLLISGPIILLLLKKFTELNFMIDVLIATAIMLAIITITRHDLIIDVLLSGIFFAIFYSIFLSIYIFLFPDILEAWNFEKFPQVLIFNIPHYEIVWAFLSGAFLGPLYEFSHNLLVKNYRG